MSRKLQVRHRLLLDLIYEVGKTQYRFRKDLGISKHKLNKILCNTAYEPADFDSLSTKIVSALVSYGICAERAVLWSAWSDPAMTNTKPRLHFVLKENGISERDAAAVLPTAVREGFRDWRRRPIEPHNKSPIIESIGKFLVPYLKEHYGLTDSQLNGWFERITPEQRTRELIEKEGIVLVSHEERKTLRLRGDPFATCPYKDDESDFFVSKDTEGLIENLIDAADQGTIGAVVGRRGSGKTTIKDLYILRLLARSQVPVPVEVGSLITKRYHAGCIVNSLLRELAGDSLDQCRHVDTSAARLRDELEHRAARDLRHVLVIDETDKLGEDDIRAIKMLNERHYKGRRLLAVTLFGQEKLANFLGSAHLAEAGKRTVVFTIKALGDNLVPYLEHRLSLEFEGDDLSGLITEEAWALFALLADSAVPKNIGVYPLDAHILLSRVLKRAAQTGSIPVTPEVVYSAFGRDVPAHSAGVESIAK